IADWANWTIETVLVHTEQRVVQQGCAPLPPGGRTQLGYRLPGTSDSDPLAQLRPRHELRKLGFGLVDVDNFVSHVHRLANLGGLIKREPSGRRHGATNLDGGYCAGRRRVLRRRGARTRREAQTTFENLGAAS